MAKFKAKSILKVLAAQLAALLLAWYFAIPIYVLMMKLFHENQTHSVGLSILYAASAGAGFLVGLILFSALCFFVVSRSVKHFILIYSLPALFLAIGSIKILILEIALILVGFLVGSAIRIGVSRLKSHSRRA